MPLPIILLAAISIFLILGGVIFSVRAGSSAQVEDRLSRYAEGSVTLDAGDTATVETPRASPLADRLDKAVAGKGFAQGMQAKLFQADLKIKVSEYLVLHVLSVILFGLISWFAFGQSVPFTIIGAALGFFAPRIYVGRVAGKRLRDFENQLGDTLNLWVNALRSGYSVLQAMETIASESPEPISTEFERVIQEVRLGLTMEEAMNNLLVRIRSDDMDLVITAVNIQREVGGNLAEVLAIISHTIRERIRIKGEIRVLTAQATISGYIISGLPIALVLFLKMTSPEYINELFIKEPPWIIPGVAPCGWLVLALGLGLIFGGFMAMRKIADIEV